MEWGRHQWGGHQWGGHQWDWRQWDQPQWVWLQWAQRDPAQEWAYNRGSERELTLAQLKPEGLGEAKSLDHSAFLRTRRQCGGVPQRRTGVQRPAMGLPHPAYASFCCKGSPE